MIQRALLLVACAILVACSSPPDSSPASRVVTSSPVPGGSPDAPTPTAIISQLAPSPSPSPSPSAIARSSPIAVASPVASPDPVGAATPPAEAASPGPRYAVVSERSQASYRARETFVGQAAPSDAVGTTTQISGDIQLEREGLLRGVVLGMKIDLRTLKSDQVRRDAYIRDNTLQTSQFPFAEFRSTATAGPPDYQAGDEVTFQIPGLMTIRGQERPIVWEARARLDGSDLTGSASSRVKLTDFGLAPPRLAVLSVEDEMTWQVDVVAQRVP